MTITVELELSSPHDLTAEEIEKDLRMAEDQIGWEYDYAIKGVKVTQSRPCGFARQKRQRACNRDGAKLCK